MYIELFNCFYKLLFQRNYMMIMRFMHRLHALLSCDIVLTNFTCISQDYFTVAIEATVKNMGEFIPWIIRSWLSNKKQSIPKLQEYGMGFTVILQYLKLGLKCVYHTLRTGELHIICTNQLLESMMTYYTPAQRSWRGVYWIHLVRPSVRLSVDDMVSGA